MVCGSSYLTLPVLISPSGADPGSAGLPPPAAALGFSEDLELTPSHPVYHPETPGSLGPGPQEGWGDGGHPAQQSLWVVPCLRWCFLSTVSIAKPRLEPQLQLKVTAG